MQPGHATGRANDPTMRLAPAPKVRSRTAWLVTFCVVVAGGVGVSAWWLPASEPVAPVHLAWWGVALLFAGCELGAAHLKSRRATDSSSVVDLAVVLGLLLATPPGLLLGQLLGAAVVLVGRRPSTDRIVRQARTVLGTGAALVVFDALRPAAAQVGAGVWFAVLAAALVAALTRRALFSAGIRVVVGRLTPAELVAALGGDVVMTVTVTCIGLTIFTLLTLQASVWLIVVPAATGLLVYRAYLVERHRHGRLDFLYGATDVLLESGGLQEALAVLMERTRVSFRAGLAEAILLPPAVRIAHRTRSVQDAPAVQEPLEADFVPALLALAGDSRGARLLSRPAPDPRLERYLRRIGADGPVVVAMLDGDPGPLGVVLVANRREVDRQFGASEVELLDRLAGHVAASLGHEILQQDFGRLEQLQGQLEHMAFHDPLTSLVNRARFGQQLAHALTRRTSLVAALFIDLDDFKTVNDSLGHGAGDELLVAVADRLRLCLRIYDTPARLGGDEFAVLIDDAESMEVVLEIAERVLRSLSEPLTVASTEVFVRASIGVATSREGGRRADDLLRNADLAMYRAKDLGKGRFELFEPEMHALAMHRHEMKSELQHVVDEDQLVVLFQPVVELETGFISGVEALVRWQHPRLGLVSPEAFIPLAEESGMIGAIGRHVLDQACDRLAAWRAASIVGDSFGVSINLCEREFQAPDLVEVLTRTAERAGVPPSAITLDITEAALMADLEGGVARMHTIKAAGFRLALDDFGSGYSSLSHLRRLPIDVVKVAKPFVDHIAEREEDVAFLRSILDFARALSLEVVVEGVESAQQARILLELGAPRVQGFVFSRPVEPRVLSALLTIAPLEGFAGGGERAAHRAHGPVRPEISPAAR